jgi:signal transduction histidine kinase
MLGATALVALVLAVLAYLLADSQAQDREDVRQRFDDVARVSASVTNGIFQASLISVTQQVSARLASPDVDDAAVEVVAQSRRLVYAAVLDARGRRLAATAGAPARFGPALDVARETGKARLSDVMPAGDGVVEWAIPYSTPAGRRIYVQGIPIASFADFLRSSLGNLPNFVDAETVMIDGNGVVLGGVELRSEVGERLADADLLAALAERERGKYGGDRYFASGAIDGSPFKIVLDTSREELYDSISASRKTLPWVIFGAFALAALAGLLLLRRALVSTAELQRRELNERHAVEINDNIIQGLALAKYQLQLGEGEASAAQVSETLREAQRLVSELLGEAEVHAGQLRRELAAETSRPDAPADDGPTP